jgi:hypothetical protein
MKMKDESARGQGSGVRGEAVRKEGPGKEPSGSDPCPLTPDPYSSFYVPPLLHFVGGLVHRNRKFWLWLGRLESNLIAQELSQVSLKAPIYVCGLARSGSTLLHEVLSSHPSVATHRIKDFPMIFTPYWWRLATANLRPKAPHERPHQDKMMITTESPDSIEEMLWMAFFPRCHDPAISSLMCAGENHPAFEAFYNAHIRKLLLAEKRSRYAAKANYHVARLPYIVRLFPDTRILIPIRAPEDHIASLMRQHQWFSEGHRSNPRALAFMQRSGHYEFGLDRRPLNLGDDQKVREVLRAWAAGEEVRGWAKYWAMVHEYLACILAADAQVQAASMLVRFETLCESPADTLRAVLAHCLVPDAESLALRHAPAIRYPTYYNRQFSPEERAIIHEETGNVAKQLGYACQLSENS